MAKIYVGNVDRRTDKRDLEQEFGKFGKIRQVQVWAERHPAGFAFVEFEDDRDAEDAIRELDDRYVCGSRLRVEWARSTGRKPAPRKNYGGNGGRWSKSKSPSGGGRRKSPSPRRRKSRSPNRRRSPSPRRRSPSPAPRRRSPSPRRRSPSPRRRSPSPRKRSSSPARRGATPPAEERRSRSN